MKTPITYYGGKQRLADEIVIMIPKHKVYVEPFFGGGAVFFAKRKSPIEAINDTNDRLISFYLNSRDNFRELKGMIDETLHSERMHQYAKDVYNRRVKHSDLEMAWAVWLITNGSFGASIYGGWKWDNGTSGSNSAIVLNNKKRGFSEQLKRRLDGVQISCRDAIKVITGRDSVETFYYLDPPYPGCEQQHYRGYTMKDFNILLEILSGIEGKFILSNYWSQTLKHHVIKNGWNVMRKEISMNINNLGKRGKVKRTGVREEILVYNFELNNKLF